MAFTPKKLAEVKLKNGTLGYDFPAGDILDTTKSNTNNTYDYSYNTATNNISSTQNMYITNMEYTANYFVKYCGYSGSVYNFTDDGTKKKPTDFLYNFRISEFLN